MSLTDKDWLDEQERVNLVIDKISSRVQLLEVEVNLVKLDVVDIRKHYWDDVTVNLSNSVDLAETHISMKQQADVLSERERAHRQAAQTLKKLTHLARAPYFGRIDFAEIDSSKIEPIYLGISTFLDENEESFLIYDWRAPISSLYYDYSPGSVTYETPNGPVSGEMSLKRQYGIRDGRISLMFDTGVTIGDELLQQVLSRNSDAQMKSIVATIQKEQNQIIRNDRSRMLIVQGAAGSGKTSAALQRVAYLLYKDRKTLQADQLVLFSPNPLFNSYVSTVLPELGEENMQQTTFQAYLEHRLSREFQLEDPFTQIEYIMTAIDSPGYKERLSGIHFKSSVAYINAIHAYKDALELEGMTFKAVRFRGCDIISSARIKERFYTYDPAIRLTNRLVLIRDWLLEELIGFEVRERNQAWVEEEIHLLDIEDYNKAYKQLRRTAKNKQFTQDNSQKEKELLSRMVVHEKLKVVRKRIKLLRFIDVTALYRQLFENKQLLSKILSEAELPHDWAEICQMTLDNLDRTELYLEDATPFLYLREFLLGFQTNTSVRHVIVDEVQDYSPFQLAFLKRLFPRCRMTALGDMNQAIFAHSSALNEPSPIIELYGQQNTELIRLSQSYRSTFEIVEFTRGMIPDGETIQPFNRNGDKPKISSATSRIDLHDRIVASIEKLQSEGYESIAIICKTANESTAAYEALNEKLSLNLISKDTLTFHKGNLIIPSYLAKGMEFDAVLIYNASSEQYSRESERKLLYTICTRAMHHLQIFTLGKLSPFILAQPVHTYLFEHEGSALGIEVPTE